MSFAAASGVDRKNPWASVEAFLGAFPDDDGVRLVVRVNEQAGPEPGDLIVRLRERAAHDSRIIQVTGSLDYVETLSLYASCDAYVSMHRSEGLGLGPMEAMSLGLPVVATGWSGNMDFMTEENSCPVPYRLIPVDVAESSPYAAGVVSGIADVGGAGRGQASAMLRRLRDDRAFRARIGTLAAESMATRRAEVLGGSFIPALAEAHAALVSRKGFWRANHPSGARLDAMQRSARRELTQQEGLRARASRMLKRR